MKKQRARIAAMALAVGFVVSAATASAATKADINAIATVIDEALEWLTTQQDDRGAWRSDYGPGITGLVVAAYLRHPHGKYTADSQELTDALDYLASVQQENGSIYDPDSQLPLPNYNTSTALMALSAANSPKFAEVVAKAREYLIGSQTDEGEGAAPEDVNYGGIGYGSDPDVRDLSNLNLALQALKDSGTPDDADVWNKAITFLNRLQNNSETNDQAYASDDGGFAYSPGVSKAGEDDMGRPRSYASMTYAGLLSFIYANVDRDDPRVQAAVDWLEQHWSLEENYPIGRQGLYYGYHTMAKALSAYGADTLEADGVRVDWYAELSNHLISMRTPEGFWPPNEADRWFEGDPVLVTAYALLALEAGYPGM